MDARDLKELMDQLPLPMREGQYFKMPNNRVARGLGVFAAVLVDKSEGEAKDTTLTMFDDKADEVVKIASGALFDAASAACPEWCSRCGNSWVVHGPHGDEPCPRMCGASSPRWSTRLMGQKFNSVVLDRLIWWVHRGGTETTLEIIDATGSPMLRATAGSRCFVIMALRPGTRVAAVEIELPKPPAPAVTPDGRCCACGQHVKTYRRSINATMASALVAFARESAHKLNGAQLMTWPVGMAPMLPFIHAPAFFARINHPAQRGGDFVRFRHYGFIAPMPGDRGDGSHRNGWWRITDAGIAFARGDASAPRYLSVYNNTVVDQSEERVTIRDVLGESFDYTDLASRPATPAEVEKTK